MWGKGNNDFYGRALREIERGVRRDDLWGKALANADGNPQKARGQYIELLAGHMEREELVFVRNRRKQKLRILAKLWSVSILGVVCVLVPLVVLSSHLYEGYKSDWIANVAVRDYPASATSARVLINAKGQSFSLPTFQQYYQVAAGMNVDSFTEVQRDLAQMRPSSIYMKYGEEAGGVLVVGFSEALRVHSLASLKPPSFFEMIQDALGLGVKSAR